MIPHVAHFFWANQTMSWLRYMTLASFRHHNPDVRMKLHWYVMPPASGTPWGSPERQEFANPEPVRDYFPEVASLDVEMVDWVPPCPIISPTHASDIFQWDILSTEGGVYCDMDILFLQPVFPQIQDHRDAYVSLVQETIPIGFLASCPENKFFRDVFETAVRRQTIEYQSAGTESIAVTIRAYKTFRPVRIMTGNHWQRLQFNAIREQFPDYNFANMAKDVMYPFWCDHVEQIFVYQHNAVRDYTIGIHWYAGHALSQEFNRRMDHENLHTFRNTYSYFAKAIYHARQAAAFDLAANHLDQK